jgi:hypothetical protein
MMEDISAESLAQTWMSPSAPLVARDMQRHLMHTTCHGGYSVQQRGGCLIGCLMGARTISVGQGIIHAGRSTDLLQ